MIRIVRGPEPQEVTDSREEHLSHACFQWSGEIDGYQGARAPMYTRQFSKCAYCENWEQQESQPVEHFRPRRSPARIEWTGLKEDRGSPLSGLDEDRFARGLPPVKRDRVRWPGPTERAPLEVGYWWLAWTWENLVFGCQSCNGTKLSRFPLMRGSPTLLVHEQPPGDEQPLLLDPTSPDTDPMDLIRFRFNGKHWAPFPVNDDARAAWSIAVLGLDGPSLLTLYSAKVKALELMARAFRNTLRPGGSVPEIQAEWSHLCGVALGPEQSFLGLTYDWLSHEHSGEIARHGLFLPRPVLHHPAAMGDASPRPPLPRRPELDGLPTDVQHRVRWLRHFHPPDGGIKLRALLVDICRARPSTTEDLIRLLGRPTTLPDHLAAISGIDLVLDPATGRWRAIR